MSKEIPKDLALVRFRHAVELYAQMWREDYAPAQMQLQLEEILSAARQVVVSERENDV